MRVDYYYDDELIRVVYDEQPPLKGETVLVNFNHGDMQFETIVDYREMELGWKSDDGLYYEQSVRWKVYLTRPEDYID